MEGFAGERGEDGDVEGAGGVGGRDRGDVDGEVDGVGGDGGEVGEERAVAQAGVGGQRGAEDGREVVRCRDEVPARLRDVGQVVQARERHRRAPSLG